MFKSDLAESTPPPAFHVEHVGEDVLLPQLGVGVEKHPLLVGTFQFEVVEGVFVGFESDVLERMAHARCPTRLAIFPFRRVDEFLHPGQKR